MFSLFVGLLSFSESLATKCLFKHTIIDMNPNVLKHYPFMINLSKCTGNCNALSPKICVPKEIKDINVKAFDMITNKYEARAMTEHISCACKFKFNITTCNSHKNGIIKHANVNVKIIVNVKKIIV